jgi:carboxypeptidase C (cathepsin A)
LSKEFWEKANLRVGTVDFARELLRDQGRVIGISDGRQASQVAQAGGRGGGRGGAGGESFVNAYVRTELGVQGAPEYRSNAPGSNNWNWFDHGLRERAPVIPGYQNFLDDVAIAMKANPRMRVQQHSGIYDLQCNYFPADWAMERMNIPEALRANIQMFDYESGHAVFANAPSEFTKFVNNLSALYGPVP